MSAEVIPVNVLREYRMLPKHSRGKRILADIAKRHMIEQIKAEVAVERVMRDFENSFFVTREEVE